MQSNDRWSIDLHLQVLLQLYYKLSKCATTVHKSIDKTCTSLLEIQQYFENAWNVIQDEVYTATNVKWLTTDHNFCNVYLSISI